MINFPATIKPITDGYRFNTPNNVMSINVMNGLPIQVLDYKFGPVEIPCTFVGGRLLKSVLSDFYYGKINSGADKFLMNLDTGFGLEEHIVQIVPGTMNWDLGKDPTTVISCTIRAEKTPAQDVPYEGSLSDAYSLYGEQILEFFNDLEEFTLVDLPFYL